jgi:hypothetical protein
MLWWYSLLAQFDAPSIPRLQADSVVAGALNIIYWVVGVVSVIMIVIGAIKYITSGGDPKGTQGAKNTILYAIIGLVVSILAFAITNFVLGGVI